MSFKDIKSKSQSQRGFTIVELLIVIVVIGILAAITIVSYTGITARANTNAAKGNASTYLQKAELYASESVADGGGGGRYPADNTVLTASAASGKSFYITSGSLTINYSTTALTSSATASTIRVLKCSPTSDTTSDTQAEITSSSTGDAFLSGIRVFAYDFVNNTEATIGNVGNTTNCPTS
jgi:prepilin-type N-terminal cleavage/methylation domain-containing protein